MSLAPGEGQSRSALRSAGALGLPGWIPWAWLLFALAAALRLPGLGYLLPHYPESDLVHAVQLHRDALDLEHYALLHAYPQLVPQLARMGRLATGRPETPRTLEEALRAAAAPVRDSRLVVALLSSLVAPATFLIARRLLPPGLALVAGLLAAVNLMHLSFSGQARPHGALTGVTAAALAALLHLRRKPGWAPHLWAGLLLAAAIGILHSALALLLPLAAAHILREGPRRRRDAWKPLTVLALVAASAAAFGLAWPSTQPSAARAIRHEGPTLWLGGHVLELARFDGEGFLALLGGFLWSCDPWLIALCLCGLGALVGWVRRSGVGAVLGSERGLDALVLAAFAVPFLLVFGLHSNSHSRFFLPLLPVLAVLGAAGAGFLARALRPLARPLALAVPAVLVAAPVLLAGKLAWLQTRPDTVEMAARWLRSEAEPRRDRLWIAPGLELPLAASAEALARDRRAEALALERREQRRNVSRFFWTRYQRDHALDLPGEPRYDIALIPMRVGDRGVVLPDPVVLAAEAPGWVVAGRLDAGTGAHHLSGLVEALRAHSGPAARFQSVPWGQEGRQLTYARVHPPFWLDLVRARRLGPYLEIFRLLPPP